MSSDTYLQKFSTNISFIAWRAAFHIFDNSISAENRKDEDMLLPLSEVSNFETLFDKWQRALCNIYLYLTFSIKEEGLLSTKKKQIFVVKKRWKGYRKLLQH